MASRLLWRCSLLLLVTAFVTPSGAPGVNENKNKEQVITREPRALKSNLGFFGFFGTIGRLIYEQYNETTSALSQINNLLTNSFSDTATTTAPVKNLEPNASTTPAPYRVSRKQLGYILGRNYRGLVRLFRLELDDALNQSFYNVEQKDRDLGNALAPFTVPKKIED